MTRSPTALPRATPSLLGVDPAGIAGFLDSVAADGLELHGFMLLRHGAVVAEGAWAPYALDIPHMLHSATKSWTGFAVGLAVDDGVLRLDDQVISFFPEHLPNPVHPHLAAMTVRDLLTMRTGHRTGISGGEWRTQQDSWVRAFLAEPVPDPPGADFMYSSGSSYMLSAIVTRVTGRTVHDLLTERVFGPTGTGPGVSWDLSSEGYSTGGNGLSCLLEDMARFGLLHLRGGLWNGRRIVSEDWVRAATSNQVREAWLGSLDGRRYAGSADAITARRMAGYGYHWWMTDHGGYRASGLFGQHCLVLPEQDAVLAINAALLPEEPRLMAKVWTHLLPAFGTPYADGPADAALSRQLASLALPTPDGATDAPLAQSISGRRWAMDSNDDGIRAVSLRFEAVTCSFTLEDERGTHRIVAGFGHDVTGETTMTGRRLHHQYEPDRLRVVARAAWPAPDCLVMTWQFVETAFRDTVTCRFEGNALRLERHVNTNVGERERPAVTGHLLTPAEEPS